MLRTWSVNISAGSQGNWKEADWTGAARDAEHAEKIGVGLTKTAWKITSQEIQGERIRVRAEDAGATATNGQFILWGDIDPTPGQIGDLENIAKSILRLARAGIPADARDFVGISTGPESFMDSHSGKILANVFSTLPWIGQTLTGPTGAHRSMSAPEPLSTAILALGILGGQGYQERRAIPIAPSASERVIRMREMQRTRTEDATNVARFLGSLGLGDEAKALSSAYA